MCPEDPSALFHVNVRGAELAVRAAARAGVPRVVLTSSAAALGEAHGTVGDEGSPHRGTFLSVYERTKHEGELAAFAAARSAGVELVAINPSSVQGPGRAGGTARILIAYLNGKLRAFIDTHISIVDIADCVEAHVLAAERGRDGERYVINGATITSRQALEIGRRSRGVEREPRFLPAPVARAAGGASRRRTASAAASRRCAARWSARCCTGTATTDRAPTRELGLEYTPSRRRSGARSSGRGPRALSAPPG